MNSKLTLPVRTRRIRDVKRIGKLKKLTYISHTYDDTPGQYCAHFHSYPFFPPFDDCTIVELARRNVLRDIYA